MADPKPYELRQRGREELERDLRDSLQELAHLRLRHATRQLDNPLRLRYLRRQVARLRTVLREDALGLRALPRAAAATRPESAPEAEG